MCTKDEAIEILGEAYSSCSAIFKEYIKEAYLYGSYARGDYNNESNVDILITIILERTDIAKFRYALATVTSDLSLKHDVTVSIIVKPHNEFILYRDSIPFYMNVVEEGIRYK